MGRNSHTSSSFLKVRSFFPLALACVLFVIISSQSKNAFAQSSPANAKPQATQGFHLTSTAFKPDGAIPVKYACNGANISPGLAWTEPPPAPKVSSSSLTIPMLLQRLPWSTGWSTPSLPCSAACKKAR